MSTYPTDVAASGTTGSAAIAVPVAFGAVPGVSSEYGSTSVTILAGDTTTTESNVIFHPVEVFDLAVHLALHLSLIETKTIRVTRVRFNDHCAEQTLEQYYNRVSLRGDPATCFATRDTPWFSSSE